MIAKTYSKSFYEKQTDRNAKIVVPIILQYITPSNVLDVGCGIGHWLNVFKSHEIFDTIGIDYDSIPRDKLVIPHCEFIGMDLSKKLVSKKNEKYDLVLCLEVAEHLPKSRSKSFIKDLTKLSPIIIFSSAIPGQGGTNHINEQWQSYWIDLFKKEGYCKIDCLRKELWDKDIEFCYKQNLFLFIRTNHLQHHPKLEEEYNKSKNTPENIVHPDMYRHDDIRQIPLRRALGIILFLPVIIKNTLWRK